MRQAEGELCKTCGGIEKLKLSNPCRCKSSDRPAGYVRPIPQALYPCIHCAEDYSWPATDLNWSEVDKGWVCDSCWDDRESNWDGEDYIEKDKGISLDEEIKRRT